MTDTTGLFIDTDGEGNTCLWRHNPNQPALPTMVAATYNTDPQVWAIITAAINAHPEPTSEPDRPRGCWRCGRVTHLCRCTDED